MEKLVIVAVSLILLTESLDRKHVTVLFINDVYIFIIVRVEEFYLYSNLGRKCILSEVLLPTSSAMLATARPSYAKDHSEIQTGSPPTRATNASGMG